MSDAGATPSHEWPASGGSAALCGAVAVFCIALVMLLATLGGPGMAWDEGITIRRQERIRAWFGEVAHPKELPSRWSAFRGEAIVDLRDRMGMPLRSYWPYTRVLEGHPPFYGTLGVVGWTLSHGWLPPLEAHRFGPALLFAIAAGAMYWSLARSHGPLAGMTAAGALVLLPRMFAHAHLASYDAPVTSFWVLAWALFLPGQRSAQKGSGIVLRQGVGLASQKRLPAPFSRWGTVAFGVMLGLALATKFTGWLAPLPFLVWCVLYRDGRAAKVLLLGGAVALVTFFAVNPPLWHHPIAGMSDFLRLNLRRGETAGLNISTIFLGRSYDLVHALPWFNTLFWTSVAVPVGTLLLGLCGILHILLGRFRDRAAVLVLLHWGLMMVLRALPGAPPHDGIRLFLPSFAFLAALAGIGASALCSWVRQFAGPPLGRWVGPALVGAALGGSALSTWLYNPVQLSHYNLLAGGLPGAVRLGMEPTYYWDALTGDVLAWLNEHTATGRTVHFAPSILLGTYLNEWGMLKPPARNWDPRPDADRYVAWYVVQLRPSSYQPVDRELLAHYTPSYVKRVRDASWPAFGAFRLDVPLIRIYSAEQYADAFHAVRGR